MAGGDKAGANQSDSAKPGDKPTAKKTGTGWNEAALAAKTGDRPATPLSAAEKAERSSRAKPKEAVAFDFKKHSLPEGEIERWYAGLSNADKALLEQPGTRIEIRGHASRPGSTSSNLELSRARAKSASRAIQERFSIPAQNIEAEGAGENRNIGNEKRDDRQMRIAEITIVAKKKAPRPSDDAAKKAGKDMAKGAKIGEASPKYTPEEGIRDLPGFLKDYKKAILESAKRLVKAIHETHEINKQASHECGVRYATLELASDGRASSKVPQIDDNKTYTGEALWKRVQNSPMRRQFDSDTAWNSIQNKGSRQQAKEAMGEVADAINKLLAKAKTPAERRAAIQTFAKATIEQLTANRRARKR